MVANYVVIEVLELFQSVFGKENVFLIMFSKYKEIDKNTHIILKTNTLWKR